MRYFVTGATGFIGGRVANQLRLRGDEVVTIARNPDKASDLRALGVEIHKGDIAEPDTLRAPMQGADGVFHIAGWYKIGTRDKAQGQLINVDGTRNVLTAMRDLGIPKGVYTSTLAINSDTGGVVVDESYQFHGQHISVYDRTKADAHAVAEDFIKAGLPLVVVMPGLVYGPGDTSSAGESIRQYLKRRLPLAPQKTAFAWAHVDDIAAAHLLAMDKGVPGESYIIAGEVRTFEQFLDYAEGVTGVPAPRLRASPGMMKAMATLFGVFDNLLPLPPTFTGEGLRVTAGVTYIGSNAKARRELGYNPRSFEDGIRDTLLNEMQELGIAPPG